LDDDESFALFVCLAIGGMASIAGCARLLRVTPLAVPNSQRFVLAIVPLSCLGLLQLVLTMFASHEVKDGNVYDVLFIAGGAAWLGTVTFLLPVLGVHAIDDALLSPNSAVVITLCGAWIGTILCYAGSNIGEGSTIWTTFIPAALATAALLALWLILELFARVSEAITIDRDTASGVRLAALLISCGLVLGRAAAGNWVSLDDTLHDFVRQGWPAVLLTAFAGVFQRLWRPTSREPHAAVATKGLFPAAGLLLISFSYVLWLGRWR
jgi:uncharacterized membrane protein YjfL (UPF0719 family)